MKWIIITCLLITNTLFGQKILWTENRKLNWTNFKSKVNNQMGANVVAYTHCGWVYSYVKSSNPNAPIKIKIETVFNEDKSWKDAKRINDYVLQHEQKHFDAAEIYARRLRKEVSERIKSTADFDKYFQGIYSKILKEYQDFQRAYDRDTKNGINEEKQSEYNRIIAEELDKLKSYTSS